MRVSKMTKNIRRLKELNEKLSFKCPIHKVDSILSNTDSITKIGKDGIPRLYRNFKSKKHICPVEGCTWKKYKGTAYDQELGNLRIKCHDKFDLLWSNKETRVISYFWLDSEFGLDSHIGNFSKRKCITLLNILNDKQEFEKIKELINIVFEFEKYDLSIIKEYIEACIAQHEINKIWTSFEEVIEKPIEEKFTRYDCFLIIKFFHEQGISLLDMFKK